MSQFTVLGKDVEIHGDFEPPNEYALKMSDFVNLIRSMTIPADTPPLFRAILNKLPTCYLAVGTGVRSVKYEPSEIFKGPTKRNNPETPKQFTFTGIVGYKEGKYYLPMETVRIQTPPDMTTDKIKDKFSLDIKFQKIMPVQDQQLSSGLKDLAAKVETCSKTPNMTAKFVLDMLVKLICMQSEEKPKEKECLSWYGTVQNYVLIHGMFHMIAKNPDDVVKGVNSRLYNLFSYLCNRDEIPSHAIELMSEASRPSTESELKKKRKLIEMTGEASQVMTDDMFSTVFKDYEELMKCSVNESFMADAQFAKQTAQQTSLREFMLELVTTTKQALIDTVKLLGDGESSKKFDPLYKYKTDQTCKWKDALQDFVGMISETHVTDYTPFLDARHGEVTGNIHNFIKPWIDRVSTRIAPVMHTNVGAVVSLVHKIVNVCMATERGETLASLVNMFRKIIVKGAESIFDDSPSAQAWVKAMPEKWTELSGTRLLIVNKGAIVEWMESKFVFANEIREDVFRVIDFIEKGGNFVPPAQICLNTHPMTIAISTIAGHASDGSKFKRNAARFFANVIVTAFNSKGKNTLDTPPLTITHKEAIARYGLNMKPQRFNQFFTLTNTLIGHNMLYQEMSRLFAAYAVVNAGDFVRRIVTEVMTTLKSVYSTTVTDMETAMNWIVVSAFGGRFKIGSDAARFKPVSKQFMHSIVFAVMSQASAHLVKFGLQIPKSALEEVDVCLDNLDELSRPFVLKVSHVFGAIENVEGVVNFKAVPPKNVSITYVRAFKHEHALYFATKSSKSFKKQTSLVVKLPNFFWQIPLTTHEGKIFRMRDIRDLNHNVPDGVMAIAGEIEEEIGEFTREIVETYINDPYDIGFDMLIKTMQNAAVNAAINICRYGLQMTPDILASLDEGVSLEKYWDKIFLGCRYVYLEEIGEKQCDLAPPSLDFKKAFAILLALSITVRKAAMHDPEYETIALFTPTSDQKKLELNTNWRMGIMHAGCVKFN
jgi:hypothetical protein